MIRFGLSRFFQFFNRTMRQNFNCLQNFRLMGSLFALFSAMPSIGQTSLTNQTAPEIQPEGHLQFTGNAGQVSLGVMNGGHFQAEISGVLSEQSDRTWLGEGWLMGSAGGVKLGYNKVDGEVVRKYFLALDQSEKKDLKFTLGAGFEQEKWFGHGYVSRGLGDRRLIDQSSVSTVSIFDGFEEGRPFQDTLTQVTTTKIFERAYDYGAGLRAGRFYSDHNLRLSAGLDVEWGRGDAQQRGLSLMVEKFYAGSPHSWALQLDQFRKYGEAELARDDTRVLLSYRYSFGASNSQPQRLFRSLASTPVGTVARPMPVTKVIPARTETKIVKTRASMTSDAFFEISSATLTSLARNELDRVATLLKNTPHEGNVRIVGHTCDLGTDKFNMQLSIKRAQSVRDYLVAAGAVAADAVLVEGKGETEPKFPATVSTRSKNRRVDLEYVSVIDKEEVVHIPAQTVSVAAEPLPEPAVTYVREEIKQEPAWLRRALRTPMVHKRTVDVYRIKEESQSESKSRVWVNRAPSLQNDIYNVLTASTTVLSVLSNDSDPDVGDTLTLVSVSAPSNGQARIDGQNIVYQASSNQVGPDSFTYTVKDSKGVSSTANVQVNVTQANRTPVATGDTYIVSGSRPRNLPVLINDTDPDGDVLSITAVTQPIGGNGTVAIQGSMIVFTPKNMFLYDSFTYTISDGKGGQATATVQLIDP